MKARYIGDPNDPADPTYVTHLGVTFRRDRWATLPENVDPVQMHKLQNHPHFEVAEGEGEDPPAEEAAQTEAAAPSHEPKASKAQIVAKLSALANKHPEVEFDPKASAKVLAQLLEEAEFAHGED